MVLTIIKYSIALCMLCLCVNGFIDRIGMRKMRSTEEGVAEEKAIIKELCKKSNRELNREILAQCVLSPFILIAKVVKQLRK